MDMHFLGDVKQICNVCHGKKYKENVLHYLYKNKTINDVLEMTVEEALNFFDNKDIIDRFEIRYQAGQ